MAATKTAKTAVAPTPEPVVISDEAKAIMDRAVRAARANSWCDRFSMISAEVFGVPANMVVDSDGFNCEGRTADGFNLDGYHYQTGLDRDGFDKTGFNKAGKHRDGGDKYRYDDRGYDKEGYDYTGTRRRADRSWYAKQAARPDSDFIYDPNGRTRPAPVKRAPRKTASADAPSTRTTTLRRAATNSTTSPRARTGRTGMYSGGGY